MGSEAVLLAVCADREVAAGLHQVRRSLGQKIGKMN